MEGLAGLLAAQTCPEAGKDFAPIGIRECADHSDLKLGQRHKKQPEERRSVEPGLSPIAHFTVGWCERLR